MTPQIEMLRALADAYDREADVVGRVEIMRAHARVHRAAASGLVAEELDRRYRQITGLCRDDAPKIAEAIRAIMEPIVFGSRRPLSPARTQGTFPATHRSTPAFAIGGVDPATQRRCPQERGQA